MEIGEYLAALRKRWWVIVLLTLLGAGLGYYKAHSTTPMYQSTSKVVVSLARGDTVSDLVQGSTYTRNLVETYVQLATVPAVLQPVIDDLHLTISARQLAGAVHAEAPLNTMIIEISASSASPKRAADVANAVAAQLATTVESLQPSSSDGVAGVKVTLVGPATPANYPFKPKVKLMAATGGAVGLALGLIIALAWTRLDTKVRGPLDLPREPVRALLGQIPYDRSVRSEGPRTIIEHPRGALAESYRRVRANLEFLDSTDPVTSVVVTSTMPQEGKSTTSVNLALALADTGRRVLLVDADLRRPALARICGLEGASGLTTILAHRATLADVRQPWGIEGLDVVTAGQVPPNPTQLIDSEAMAAFLVQAQAEYDMVIVDTSPLLAVTDGAVLARRVSGAIVVVRARRVDRRDLQESLTTIDGLGATCLGLVLNAGPSPRRKTSYGYMEPKKRARTRRPKNASSAGTATIVGEALTMRAADLEPTTFVPPQKATETPVLTTTDAPAAAPVAVVGAAAVPEPPAVAEPAAVAKTVPSESASTESASAEVAVGASHDQASHDQASHDQAHDAGSRHGQPDTFVEPADDNVLRDDALDGALDAPHADPSDGRNDDGTRPAGELAESGAEHS